MTVCLWAMEWVTIEIKGKVLKDKSDCVSLESMYLYLLNDKTSQCFNNHSVSKFLSRKLRNVGQKTMWRNDGPFTVVLRNQSEIRGNQQQSKSLNGTPLPGIGVPPTRIHHQPLNSPCSVTSLLSQPNQDLSLCLLGDTQIFQGLEGPFRSKSLHDYGYLVANGNRFWITSAAVEIP